MKYSEIENELFYSEEDYYQEYQFIKIPKTFAFFNKN